MHAVLHSVSIHDRAVAEAELETLVPQISGAQDFAGGYWIEGPVDTGVAVLMFDSEQGAKGFAEMLRGAPDSPGVTLDRNSIHVGQVIKHA